MTRLYNERLEINPDVKGRMVVIFYVQSSGLVTQPPVIESSSLNDTVFERRIIEYIKTWDYGKCESRKKTMQIMYPLDFNIKLKNVRSGFLPVISLNGLLSTDYYNNHLRLGNSDYWFGNSNINLSLHIPITEGIERTRRIKQQKYRIKANMEELNSALNKKQLEIKRFTDNVSFYGKEIIAKKDNLDLARENLNASLSLFTEGRILPSGLTEAEISYKQVKIDYLKALFNYLDSLLELKRIIRS